MKQIILFACLAVLAAACTPIYVTVTPTVADNLVPTAGQLQEQEMPATETPAPAAAESCALISADQALHLRKAPGQASRVLAYLLSGEEVQVISTANADWWQVKSGSVTGYARSKYLQSGACHESR